MGCFFFDEYVVFFHVFSNYLLVSILFDFRITTISCFLSPSEYPFPMLYSELMSILILRCVSWMWQRNVFNFFFHLFCQSVSFYWRIETIDIDRYQWPMIVDSYCFIVVCGVSSVCIYVCWCVSASIHSFDFAGVRSFIPCFEDVVTSLGWMLPPTIFCRAEYVDGYCLNLDLLCNILFSVSNGNWKFYCV